ncbi:hypothetical protein MKW92_009573 [Papaver armeniacum]|nr:hypothetical protein MKW92_009573 [Papaver armeniacum]
MASFFSYHLIFSISLLLTFIYVNAEDPWWSFCNDNKKINNAQISSNIDQILPVLVSQTSNQGYTFLSSGSGDDRVYGQAQCRGDVVNTKECSNCVKEASIQIQKLCPNQADARIIYEYSLDRKNLFGFGKGQTKLSKSETLYSLVQCTRDLSKFACSQCLATAVGNYAGFCKDKKGCRAIYSSCFVRYELYPIFYPVNSINSTDKNVYSRHMLHP